MYVFYNSILRGWAPKGGFITTTHAINSGIIKLSKSAQPPRSRLLVVRAPPLTHNTFSRRLGVASVWFVHADSTAQYAGNCTGHRTAKPPWTIQRLCELPLLASDHVSGVRVTLAGSSSTGYNFAITGVYVRPSGA